MSMTYSAGVFFGAFVKSKSPLGKRLEKYVEKAGGTPAETETTGVEIDEVGSQPTGETWTVVRATGSEASFERGDDTAAPKMLTEDPTWRPRLQEFFYRLKLKDPPPEVGWHFAGSVS